MKIIEFSDILKKCEEYSKQIKFGKNYRSFHNPTLT